MELKDVHCEGTVVLRLLVCLQENYLQSGKRKRLSWRQSSHAPAEEGPMELPDPERELAMRSATEPSHPRPCDCLHIRMHNARSMDPAFWFCRAGDFKPFANRSKKSCCDGCAHSFRGIPPLQSTTARPV